MSAYFPEMEHSAAACFHCAQPLDGVPVRDDYPVGSGAWHQYCAACDMRTFYDTPRPGNPGILGGVEAKFKGVEK